MATKLKVQIIIWFKNIDGKEIREFCAYSRDYKLSVHQIYKQARSQDGADFLTEVLKEMPFTINDIQVDMRKQI